MVINSGQRTKEQIQDQIVNIKKHMTEIKDDSYEYNIDKDALQSLETLLETQLRFC